MTKNTALFLLGFIPYILGRLLYNIYLTGHYFSLFLVIGFIFLAGWFYLAYRLYAPDDDIFLDIFLLNWFAILMRLVYSLLDFLPENTITNLIFRTIQSVFVPLMIPGILTNEIFGNRFPMSFVNTLTCALFLMLAATENGCVFKECKAMKASKT